MKSVSKSLKIAGMEDIYKPQPEIFPNSGPEILAGVQVL